MTFEVAFWSLMVFGWISLGLIVVGVVALIPPKI